MAFIKLSGELTLTQFLGGCLCGEIKYSIDSKPQEFYLCHCQQCRKITGSAFASNIQLKLAEVNWLSGEENIKRFDFPGERNFTKVFCSNCGSSLPYINEKGTALVIPAGSLDHTPEISPKTNIFWEDKAEWLEEGINANKRSGF